MAAVKDPYHNQGSTDLRPRGITKPEVVACTQKPLYPLKPLKMRLNDAGINLPQALFPEVSDYKQRACSARKMLSAGGRNQRFLLKADQAFLRLKVKVPSPKSRIGENLL